MQPLDAAFKAQFAASDPDRDYQSYAEDARCGEWDRLMRTYQRRIPTADPTDGGWWTPMELVFDLEEQDG